MELVMLRRIIDHVWIKIRSLRWQMRKSRDSSHADGYKTNRFYSLPALHSISDEYIEWLHPMYPLKSRHVQLSLATFHWRPGSSIQSPLESPWSSNLPFLLFSERRAIVVRDVRWWMLEERQKWEKKNDEKNWNSLAERRWKNPFKSLKIMEKRKEATRFDFHCCSLSSLFFFVFPI